jgi:hypothetical protein
MYPVHAAPDSSAFYYLSYSLISRCVSEMSRFMDSQKAPAISFYLLRLLKIHSPLQRKQTQGDKIYTTHCFPDRALREILPSTGVSIKNQVLYIIHT